MYVVDDGGGARRRRHAQDARRASRREGLDPATTTLGPLAEPPHYTIDADTRSTRRSGSSRSATPSASRRRRRPARRRRLARCAAAPARRGRGPASRRHIAPARTMLWLDVGRRSRGRIGASPATAGRSSRALAARTASASSEVVEPRRRRGAPPAPRGLAVQRMFSSFAAGSIQTQGMRRSPRAVRRPRRSRPPA